MCDKAFIDYYETSLYIGSCKCTNRSNAKYNHIKYVKGS